MIVEILNHTYQYEMEKLVRVFLPNEKITVVFESTAHENGEAVLSTEIAGHAARVTLRSGETVAEKTAPLESEADGDRERTLAALVYEIMTAQTGYRPKWGLLTGVRPSKLFFALQAERDTDYAVRCFTDRFFVSAQKTALTASVAAREAAVLQTSRPDSCSLYVAIPFCPSRCSYCSFVSHAITADTAKKLIPEYVSLLVREIEETGAYAAKLGLRLESVYFGGGTPTSLSAEQLETMLQAVARAFDLSTAREYTVEAGRPDTVTREKLRVLKDAGVTRISINPQTFNDAVLREIGRRHTSEMTESAYLAAREAGFSNINMDFIAGLPGDTPESFRRSICKAVALDPESITVHTLALKRASGLGTQNTPILKKQGEAADEMLDYAYSCLTRNAYFPYYMYRQSKTLGNLENTGYAKMGFECLYNIFMMEECHTVFAVGAGAVTKLKAPHGKDIERIFNYKYPYEYISGFAEILKRKQKILPFYGKYSV